MNFDEKEKKNSMYSKNHKEERSRVKNIIRLVFFYTWMTLRSLWKMFFVIIFFSILYMFLVPFIFFCYEKSKSEKSIRKIDYFSELEGFGYRSSDHKTEISERISTLKSNYIIRQAVFWGTFSKATRGDISGFVYGDVVTDHLSLHQNLIEEAENRINLAKESIEKSRKKIININNDEKICKEDKIYHIAKEEREIRLEESLLISLIDYITDRRSDKNSFFVNIVPGGYPYTNLFSSGKIKKNGFLFFVKVWLKTTFWIYLIGLIPILTYSFSYEILSDFKRNSNDVSVILFFPNVNRVDILISKFFSLSIIFSLIGFLSFCWPFIVCWSFLANSSNFPFFILLKIVFFITFISPLVFMPFVGFFSSLFDSLNKKTFYNFALPIIFAASAIMSEVKKSSLLSNSFFYEFNKMLFNSYSFFMFFFFSLISTFFYVKRSLKDDLD